MSATESYFTQNKSFTAMVKSLKNTCKTVPFLVKFNIQLTLSWIFFKDFCHSCRPAVI